MICAMFSRYLRLLSRAFDGGYDGCLGIMRINWTNRIFTHYAYKELGRS
jgi:hypothetical protein